MRPFHLALPILAIGFSQSVNALSFGTQQNPDHACLVSNAVDATKKCKKGDLLVYTPKSWGNEQLPLLLGGAFCDYTYPIVYNTSGISCVFSDDRKKQWAKDFGVGRK